MGNNAPSSRSVFQQDGFRTTLRRNMEFVQRLYMEDEIPWVIGYSGGKDSTATLQLVWVAIAELAE